MNNAKRPIVKHLNFSLSVVFRIYQLLIISCELLAIRVVVWHAECPVPDRKTVAIRVKNKVAERYLCFVVTFRGTVLAPEDDPIAVGVFCCKVIVEGVYLCLACNVFDSFCFGYKGFKAL